MEVKSYKEMESYLQHKQVYFRRELCDVDFRTIAESGKVHEIGKCEFTRINADTVAMCIDVNRVEITVYLNMSDTQMYAWIGSNFITVSDLMMAWEYFIGNVKR